MKVVDSSTGQPYSALQLAGTSQDFCAQFSCFTSFLTSSAPMTAVLTRPVLSSVAYWCLHWCPAALLSVLFQSPLYYLLCPTKPIFRTHNHRFSHIHPSRPRTELKSSKSSAQHLGRSSPSSGEAARKLRLAIYLCKAHMTCNLLWECK